MLEIKNLISDEGFASNCYLVISADEYIIVDPSVRYEAVISRYPVLRGKAPEYVVLTHEHYDHIKYINSYAEAGVPILVSRESGAALSDSHRNCADFLGNSGFGFFGKYTAVGEGEAIAFGADSFTVIKTPGHTEGSICLVGGGNIISGDTIFSGGSYGRYDLPSGDVSALVSSLKRVLSYPDDYKIYPGHGGYTTVGEEKLYYNF